MLKSSSRLLLEYKSERDILLNRILLLLQIDPRVKAAWLAGSLGRREGDELSDLDLWVLLEKKNLTQVVNERRNFAAQFGNPILFVEAPQNAPAGGGYLAVCYDAPTAPHLVDWYWLSGPMPLPSVKIQLLFDRSATTGQADPIPFAGQATSIELPGKLSHSMSFFWMMLLITAKYVARQSPKVAGLMDITVSAFRQAGDLIASNSNEKGFSTPIIPQLGNEGGRLQLLSQLADGMEKMMVKASAMGYQTPEQVVSGARHYLEMVDELKVI